MDLKEKVRTFIMENMAIIDDDIILNETDNIFEKGFVDSMFAMRLVGFVESEFNIEVSNEDLDISNFSSVQNITKYINKKAA